MDTIITIYNDFIDFCYQLLLSLKDILLDLFWSITDLVIIGVVGVVSFLFEGVTAFNPTIYIALIPPQTKYYMAMSGFNESMGMVVAALGIRLVMSLIPFIGLGR